MCHPADSLTFYLFISIWLLSFYDLHIRLGFIWSNSTSVYHITFVFCWFRFFFQVNYFFCLHGFWFMRFFWFGCSLSLNLFFFSLFLFFAHSNILFSVEVCWLFLARRLGWFWYWSYYCAVDTGSYRCIYLSVFRLSSTNWAASSTLVPMARYVLHCVGSESVSIFTFPLSWVCSYPATGLIVFRAFWWLGLLRFIIVQGRAKLHLDWFRSWCGFHHGSGGLFARLKVKQTHSASLAVRTFCFYLVLSNLLVAYRLPHCFCSTSFSCLGLGAALRDLSTSINLLVC